MTNGAYILNMTNTDEDVLSVTDEAAERAKKLLKKRNLGDMGIRISVDYKGSNANYVLEFSDDPMDDDIVTEVKGLEFFIENESIAAIEDSTIDFIDDGAREGFTVKQPHESGDMEFEDSLEGRIREFLALNFPQIQGHGGKAVIDELDESDGYLKLSLEGSCSGCGISDATSRAIKNRLPASIDKIEKVDISAGDDSHMEIDPPV